MLTFCKIISFFSFKIINELKIEGIHFLKSYKLKRMRSVFNKMDNNSYALFVTSFESFSIIFYKRIRDIELKTTKLNSHTLDEYLLKKSALLEGLVYFVILFEKPNIP